MGRVGRDLADALAAFGIPYSAIARDEKRLWQAVADGYDVSFGDVGNPQVWQPLAASGYRILVLTAPSFEVEGPGCDRTVAPSGSATYSGGSGRGRG